jgi:xanthine dehydrogenase YagT iron-sulfur-binding subunit
MINQNQAPDWLPEGTRTRESADIVLLDTNGTRHRLSEFRGSPLVLVFHTPNWDPTRIGLVEAYNRVVAHLPSGGGRLVSIAPDAPWHALAFTGDDTVSVPIIVSDALELRRHFGIDARAAVILLDSDGNIRWRHAATHALPRPDVLAYALDKLAPTCDEHTAIRPAAWTRREFVATILAAGVVLMLPPLAQSAAASTERQMDDHAPGVAVTVTLNVNGKNIPLMIEPRVTLLDALREYAGLPGTKKGCDHGQCGACTVHMDGRRMLSCLTLAMMAEGGGHYHHRRNRDR